jgi:hypothetical protein
MRSALLLFGAFSSMLVAIAPACSGPPPPAGTGAASSSAASSASSSSSGAGGSGGAPIDGMQACLDALSLAYTYCQHDANWELLCQEWFGNGGPECEDENAVLYACELAAVKAAIAANEVTCPYLWYCLPERAAADNCRKLFGCTRVSLCDDSMAGPNGGFMCDCAQLCRFNIPHEYRCWPEGTNWFCECSVDGVPAGTCEQPPAPACIQDDTYGYFNVWESCCNQFFKL